MILERLWTLYWFPGGDASCHLHHLNFSENLKTLPGNAGAPARAGGRVSALFLKPGRERERETALPTGCVPSLLSVWKKRKQRRRVITRSLCVSPLLCCCQPPVLPTRLSSPCRRTRFGATSASCHGACSLAFKGPVQNLACAAVRLGSVFAKALEGAAAALQFGGVWIGFCQRLLDMSDWRPYRLHLENFAMYAAEQKGGRPTTMED